MHDLLVETNAYAIDFFCLLEYLSKLEAELDLNHHYKKGNSREPKRTKNIQVKKKE